MKPSDRIKAAVAAFDGVVWSNAGEPSFDPTDPRGNQPGWVKFGIQKSELGWRTLEFLGWVTTDMIRAGERIEFFPTAPPPYLNEPGECLSFVIEVHPMNDDPEERFSKIANFLNDCRERHWDACKPDSDGAA